jgi:hypothetical protein
VIENGGEVERETAGAGLEDGTSLVFERFALEVDVGDELVEEALVVDEAKLLATFLVDELEREDAVRSLELCRGHHGEEEVRDGVPRETLSLW